jgi:hypothetical protein
MWTGLSVERTLRLADVPAEYFAAHNVDGSFVDARGGVPRADRGLVYQPGPGSPRSNPHERQERLINSATCTNPNNSLTCQDFKFVQGVPFRGGDYNKNPIDNGQVGVRFVFNPMDGLNMSLAYFYQRFNFDDGSSPTFLQPVDQTGPTPSAPTNNLILLGGGTLPANIVYPYINTVGMTATYDDANITGTVYRLETIADLDLPFTDTTKPQFLTNPDCLSSPPGPTCALAPVVPDGLHFVTKSDMWKGLLGFDRDTPMPWLNKRKTISFSGQFFWHYMVSNPDDFIGGFGANDRIHRWELLGTLAAYTDYFTRFGNDNPSAFIAIDPVNHWNFEAGWRNTLFITNDLILTVFQSYFVVPGFGGAVDEPWGVAGVNKKRDETGVKITRQF